MGAGETLDLTKNGKLRKKPPLPKRQASGTASSNFKRSYVTEASDFVKSDIIIPSPQKVDLCSLLINLKLSIIIQ